VTSEESGEESGGTAESAPPLLRIVKGNPSPEETAALVAVVSAMAGAAAEQAAQEEAPRPEWSARHRLLRKPHRHGPGAWRASAR
jgi:hypothetical protein